MTASILVVEHEASVAELQRRYLARAGFTVTVAPMPARVRVAVRTHRFAAVVIDTTMPGLDVAALRAELALRVPRTPAVFLVAGGHPDGSPGRSSDAWLNRPFAPRELVERVRAAVRPADPGDAAVPRRLGRLTIEACDRRVLVDGAERSLTVTEYDLLLFLVDHPGRVHTREQLLGAVWPGRPQAGDRTVDVHVAQIRAKLGSDSPIRTVRGVGYTADHSPDQARPSG